MAHHTSDRPFPGGEANTLVGSDTGHCGGLWGHEAEFLRSSSRAACRAALWALVTPASVTRGEATLFSESRVGPDGGAPPSTTKEQKPLEPPSRTALAYGPTELQSQRVQAGGSS